VSVEWPSVAPNPLPKPRKPPGIENLSDGQLIDLCRATVQWQQQEMIRNHAEAAALRKLVLAYHDEAEQLRNVGGVRRSAYEILLDIANDPSRDDGARIRAAEAAAQYERPKLSAAINQTTNITSIGDELDRARQRMTTLPKLIDR
jgi:hypothetical protein